MIEKDVRDITMFFAVVSTPSARSRNSAMSITIAMLRTHDNAIFSIRLISFGNIVRVNANPGMNRVSSKPKIILSVEAIIFFLVICYLLFKIKIIAPYISF